MKILFLNGQYPFCYYYRGYLPAVYGGNMAVEDFMRKDMKVSSEHLKAMSEKADVIVFQRPSDKKSLELATLLKKKGKKIIFENDDTYSAIPLERLDNDAQRKVAEEMNQNLNEFLAISDGVIASTEVLAKEYALINPNVCVLKNTIDPLDEIPCKENTTGKFRVGLIGSVTTNDDYFHIKEDLRKLDERGDVTIVILGVKFQDGTHLPIMQEDYDFWASLKNIEWHTYCHVTEYFSNVAELALDVAIIPRKEHYFNQCKSNLKFLEMSLLKIPVIAQGFSDGTSPYQGIDEEYMTVLTNNNWYNEIIKIKENSKEAKEKASKAYLWVLKNYSIKEYAKVWTEKINNLIK